MFDPTLGRYGIKPGFWFVDAAEAHHAVLSKNFTLDRERRGECADAVLSESLNQRAVVEFADNARGDALTLEPRVEHSSIGASVGG
jgi:hypothetical protein